MSSVVSVKVKREIKEEMLKYSGRINWAEEIRRFIEERLRQIKAEENIRRVVEELSEIPFESPKGSSAGYVREDRDSR